MYQDEDGHTSLLCKIGMFNCGAGPKLLDKSKVFSDVACGISAVGAVCFIGILLIMAGVEPNPGPPGTHDRNNPLCKNWNRVAYGYRNFMKTGLAGFVAGQIGHRHNLLKLEVGQKSKPCSGCTITTLLPDHRTDGCNQGSICLCQQDPCRRKKCPNNFCGHFYHLIVDDHVKNSPSWSNTDSAKWYADHFQYAKCFLTTDSSASSVSDLDCAELLTIVIHNKHIRKNSIKEVASFEQCWKDQEIIFNSGNFEVTDSELEDYFDHMISVLKDGNCLFEDSDAMQAVEDLNKLKNTLMQLSDEDIDELLQKTSEATFVFRFQYLLIEIGTKVLSKLFDVQVGQNFGHHLASKRDEKNKPLLDKLKDLIKKKHITAAQTQYLPPKDKSPSSTNFDISLLTCLLRNVCGLRPAEDLVWIHPFGHSVEEDIARLRDCRNNLLHGTVFIRKTDFTTKWNELCEILLRLNKGLEEKCRITNLQDLINESQTCCIDENRREEFTKIINAWEKSDSVVIAELKRHDQGMHRRFDSLEQEMKQIKGLLIAKITVDTQSQEARQEAHSSILNAARTFASDGQEQTCGTEVQTACNNLLSDMKDEDVVIDSVKEGSILITFRCPTRLALERLRQYITERMYEEKLAVLENAVSKCIMCPVKLNISIAPEHTSSALMQTDIAAGKKSVVLTFKWRSYEGVKNAVSFLTNGSSNNKMKELSVALSRSVGEDVTLHTTVDFDKCDSENIDQPSLDGNIALQEEHYKKYIFRYKYLLVEIGTVVMRKMFDFKVGFDFVKHLSANHNKFYKQLQSLISAKIITADQAQHLPPIDNWPKSTNMDITLLVCLLRNVCGLRGPDDPVWKNPPSTDFSLEADLARLKECRNNLQHSGKVFISRTDLADKWNELSQILNRLNTACGIPHLSSLINDANSMDIDEELKDRHDQVIKSWTDMDNLCDSGVELKLVQSGMQEISTKQQVAKRPIEDKEQTHLECKRQTMYIGSDMSDIKEEMADTGSRIREENTSLLLEISKLCHRRDREVENILLLGMSGAGKSALVNTVLKVIAGQYIPKAAVGKGTAASKTLTLSRFDNCGVTRDDIVEGLQRDIVWQLIDKKLLPTLIDVAGKGNVNNPEMCELLELLIGGFIPPGTSIEALEKIQGDYGIGALRGTVYTTSNSKWKVDKVVFVQGCHDALPDNMIECLQSVLRITDEKTGVPKYTQDVYVVITKYDLVSELPQFECGAMDHSLAMEEFEKKEADIAEQFNITGALQYNRIRWVSYVDSVGHDNPYIDNIALKFLKRMVTPRVVQPEPAEAPMSPAVLLKLNIKRFLRESNFSLSSIFVIFLIAVVAIMLYSMLAKSV